MCSQMNWHDYGLAGQDYTVPDTHRRVLVAQDDGYIEIGYWDGTSFQFDWPTALEAQIPRVKYWCDLPDTPTDRLEHEPVMAALWETDRAKSYLQAVAIALRLNVSLEHAWRHYVQPTLCEKGEGDE